MELKGPHLNEINYRAMYNISTDASYVYKCIENIAKRSDKRTLTKFITYAQKGMWMLIMS